MTTVFAGMWIVAFTICLAGCANPKANSPRERQERETALLMKKFLAEARTLPSTVEGVKAGAQVLSMADLKLRRLHGHEGTQKFFATLKEIRGQQLTNTKEALIVEANAIAESGNVPAERWFWTSIDRGHPTFIAVQQIRQKEINRQNAQVAARQAEERQRAWEFLGQALSASVQASRQNRENMMARGICPDCAGAGEVTETSQVNCVVCGGTRIAPGGGPLRNCTACGGTGRSIMSDSTTRRCQTCNATGKYPAQ